MKRFRKKIILVAVLLVALLTLSGVILLHLELATLQDKEQEQCQMRLDAIAEVVRSAEARRDASSASFEENLRAHVRFMTTVLAEDVTEAGYAGPARFKNGAAVTLRGDQVLWPEGVPEACRALTAEDIREGRRIEAETPSGGNDPSDAPSTRTVFLSGPVSENCYYVHWALEDSILLDQFAYLQDSSFLEIAEESFDGSLLLVSTGDSSLSLLYESTAWPGVRNAAELGFTPETVAKQQPVLQINGEDYLCTYAEIDSKAATLIYLRLLRPTVIRGLLHVCAGELSALIILASLITYMIFVQIYVRDHRLSKLLEDRYHPKHFRRIITMAGITGAVLVFASTAVFQTLDALHEESILGARSLNRLFEYLQESSVARIAREQEQEDNWYIAQGEELAELISRRPEAAGREKLQEYCDLLGIDYIMLFDPEGREIATNSNYAGFTMDAGLGKDSPDFRRLLNGIPAIVHEASQDPMTETTRQMIGVTMPAVSTSPEAPHGALIMAIVPKSVNSASVADQLRFLDSSVRLCFFVNPENGVILYSNNASLIGRTVLECGLPEACLADGYTDFATVNGVDSYVTTARQEAVHFIYSIRASALFSNTLPASCYAVISYLVIFWILTGICLRGYDVDTFKSWIAENEHLPELIASPDEDIGTDQSNQHLTELILSRNRSDLRWADRTPEAKARIIMKIDILLLILIPSLFLLGREDLYFGGTSLFNFILHGNWTRGINLFAIVGILSVLSIGYIFLVLCNVLLSLIAGFAGRSTETICRLLYTLFHYIVVLVNLYYVFEYIGLSLSTYIASLSMVSLALSIGSKDMIADILAGVLILFERQVQVGDIVEVDGYRGKVLEVGIRSTRLLGSGDDVKYINNSNIRSIINKSKRISACVTELILVVAEPFEKTEELFRAELSKIAAKEPRIIGDLTVKGITKMNGGGRDHMWNVTVSLVCKCRESDQEYIQHYVTREIFLLCEREGIEIGVDRAWAVHMMK